MTKKRCKIFGHKWRPVVIRKGNEYRFIGAFCGRCWFGKDDLLKYVEKNSLIINSHADLGIRYWEYDQEK